MEGRNHVSADSGIFLDGAAALDSRKTVAGALFNVAVFTLGVLSRYVSAVRHCHGRLAVDSDFGRLLCRSSILGDGEML